MIIIIIIIIIVIIKSSTIYKLFHYIMCYLRSFDYTY